jgi:hypothetical protein
MVMPASVGRYVEAGLQGADNTKRGYAAKLRSFEDYCQHHQLLHLPAEVSTAALPPVGLSGICQSLALHIHGLILFATISRKQRFYL